MDSSTRRVAKLIATLIRRADSGRARQLPASSVTLDDGSTQAVADTATQASDAHTLAEVQAGQLDDLAQIGDTTVVESTFLPERIAGSDASADASYDTGVAAWEVARVAQSGVQDALDQAAQAIEDAANALTTSSGRNARRRGQTEPVPPPGGWIAGDQWIVDNADGVPSEVRVWNGTAFVFEQILAAELLVVSGGGKVRLADGVVTADAIAADAIDGLTITGATVRTAATGQRFELDAFGFTAYDKDNIETAVLQPSSGGFMVGRPGAHNFTSINAFGLHVDDTKGTPPTAGGVRDNWASGLLDARVLRISDVTPYGAGNNYQYGSATAYIDVEAEPGHQHASLDLSAYEPGRVEHAGVFLSTEPDASSVNIGNSAKAGILLSTTTGSTPDAYVGVSASGARDRSIISDLFGDQASLRVRSSAGVSAISQVEVRAESGTPARIIATGGMAISAPGAVLELDADLKYRGDIPLYQAAASGSPPDRVGLRNSWTNRIVAGFWNGFNTQRKAGIVYGQAAVFKGATFAALEVIGVLPPALCPAEPLPAMAHFTGYPAGTRRVDFVLIRPNGEIVPAVGSTDTQTQIVFTFSYPN